MIMDKTYLILSGEGNHTTENQFVMQCSTASEALVRFNSFKRNEYKNTELFIFKAELIKEQ